MNSHPLMQHILELKAWHESGGRAGVRVSVIEDRSLAVNDESFDEPESTGTATAYVPTQAEIHAACLRIQQEWTESERRRRAGWRDTPRHRSTHVLRVDTIW